MNKRYMDFVPVKPMAKKPEVVLPHAETSRPAETAPHPAEAGASKIAGPTEVDEFAISEIFEERAVHTPAGVTRSSARLGMIQDLGPRFVKTEVEKRALGQPSFKPAAKVEAEQELKELKSEKLVGRSATHSALTGKKLSAADGAMTAINASARENAKTSANSPTSAQATLQVPKFVNLEKVKKRPLSKNVYTKPVTEPTEIPKGPVTIIAKPEKDSRAGMIVAVIITIILGATAGTVAFLLLPK